MGTSELPKIKTAMLMAAGLGTRLLPFTQNRAKAVLPVMGIPVADFALQALRSAGVERVVANVHHDAARTSQTLKNSEWGGASLEFSDESSLLLGSAGALRKALPLLGEGPFFFSNADVICDVDWQKLGETHLRLRRQWGVTLTLAIFRRSPRLEDYREIFLDHPTRLITGLGELRRSVPFFCGAAVIEVDALKNVPEGVADFVSLILRPAIQRREAGFFLSDGMWFDVGSPQSWLDTHLQLMKALEYGQFSSPLAQTWRRTLEKSNRRVGSQIWVSRSSPHRINTAQWQAPCYWDAQYSAQPPSVLGPNSVLYGSLPAVGGSTRALHGIGHDGVWVKTP